jgi:hypothetical protein
MVWFKVDDSFHSHPKVLATSPAALGLWVVAGAWSGANLTDGFVPDSALQRLLPDSAELAAVLVTAGLWRRAKGGYRFHDWGDYNPNSSDVKKERDAARERMRNLRAKRKPAGQSGNRSGEQGANVRAKFADRSQPRPDPTRSSPNGELTEESPPASPGPPKGSRGARLPDDFVVTEEMAGWAREKAPSCGPVDHEAFCDYWRGTPGAKGRKTDWPATWRNWMRREHERRTQAPRPAANGRGRATADDRIADIQALKLNPPNGAAGRPLNLIQGELA